MSEEHNCLILTSWHDPKLRHTAHAQKCKSVLHSTESLKHVDIEIFGSKMEYEHNC